MPKPRSSRLFPEMSDVDSATSHTRAPLPDRMRPQTLNEYAGQEHILGPGKPLRNQIEKLLHPSRNICKSRRVHFQMRTILDRDLPWQTWGLEGR